MSPTAFNRHQNHFSHASGSEKTTSDELMNNTHFSSCLASIKAPHANADDEQQPGKHAAHQNQLAISGIRAASERR